MPPTHSSFFDAVEDASGNRYIGAMLPSGVRSLLLRSHVVAFSLVALMAVVGLSCKSGEGSDASGSSEVPPLDLATVSTDLIRVHGSTGNGSEGVPVAGGHDIDGDTHRDIAFAAMRATALGRMEAGEVFLVFGDGTIGGPALDTGVRDARILHFLGSAAYEHTGSEIWMDDVTGDGVGDLLIASQNYDASVSRVGVGSVSIVVGGPVLRTHAASEVPIDLAAPPMGITITTLIGAEPRGRLGIWLRTGDVTGDGVADLLIGADQEASTGDTHSGAVYLVRGGEHLAAGTPIDLIDFGTTAIAGHIAKVIPPAVGSGHFHFGATCQLADLDANGRAEVLVGATLNRAGAGLEAEAPPTGNFADASGGAQDGALYIAWDDNFLDDENSADPVWTPGYVFAMDAALGSTSVVRGGEANISFGEEILGGLDFDDDGTADLFVGDIVGDLSPGRSRRASGSGHLIYNAASLKNEAPFTLDTPPDGFTMTTFIGPEARDIASDTALQGDFDGDGLPDIAFSSPHGSPRGRDEAGIVHIAHGQVGVFPEVVDLRDGNEPDASEIRLTEIQGVKPHDVLCYSAAVSDHDRDGIDDLVVNEMLGDGLQPGTEDAGNLIVISGKLVQDLY
jgi:hypothetical protein